jgi:hypothetical protein
LQSANVTVTAIINSPLQGAYERTKSDLSAYEAARRDGIQPGGTSGEKVRQAREASKLLGQPYNASKMPPANLIVNKTTAAYAKAGDGA